MLRSSENETEILLGNKQLLGIFFVVAILLGVAFTGGYMVGRGATTKKAETAGAAPSETTTDAANNGSGGETHSVGPAESTTGSGAGSNAPDVEEMSAPAKRAERSGAQNADEAPLGTRNRKKTAPTETAATPEPRTSPAAERFLPQNGQEFLQVAAVSRDEALAIADVLHRKGFRAHAVPRPGTANLYRVLIGPIRDAGDLSSTRDALHKTGFRDVIVQRY